MSTHNIGFYEDLTKIIFELSSNIIKIRTLFLLLVEAYKPYTKSAVIFYSGGFMAAMVTTK